VSGRRADVIPFTVRAAPSASRRRGILGEVMPRHRDRVFDRSIGELRRRGQVRMTGYATDHRAAH
jgi:hypothetical protein